MRLKRLLVLSVVAMVMLVSNRARAEDAGSAARVRAALEQMEAEPSIIDVHRAALRYFRVHPEAVERIRRVAVRRAAAPVMSVTGRYEYVTSDRAVLQYAGDFHDPTIPPNASANDGFGSNIAGGSLTLTWDFPGLVFNAAELQTYALIGIQMNVLKEVTRLFYVRRQLLLSLLADPPDDPRTRVAMRMRVEEFTSLIDSFTGGWFSRNLPGASDDD
jgi:hypothetical protein